MQVENKTFHIVIIGCQMNKSDSERISGYLELHGFKKTDRDKAGLVFITTCGVRQSAEDRIYGLIPTIKKNNSGARIILTGCLSERKDVQKRLEEKVDIWLSITDLPKLADKLGLETKTELLDSYLKIAPKYESKYSAFVPIGNGCDNFCSYCVVPYARGREVYRDADEVVGEVKDLVSRGYKEVTLIAQNVNSYKSGEIRFPDLLRMVNTIEGDFWIRFATSHPKDMNEDLIEAVAECDKLCRYIHLPVQAGDNDILEAMNRKYTVESYLGLLEKIRKILNTDKFLKTRPEVSITTDTIVGFPGETVENFNNTVDLYKEAKYDMAYVARFSPRYGTAAAKMEDNVSPEDKKKREEILMEIVRKSSLENNKKYIGKAVKVLVEGRNKKGELYGKTETFKNVKINLDSGEGDYVGKFVEVVIDEAKDLGLTSNSL